MLPDSAHWKVHNIERKGKLQMDVYDGKEGICYEPHTNLKTMLQLILKYIEVWTIVQYCWTQFFPWVQFLKSWKKKSYNMFMRSEFTVTVILFYTKSQGQKIVAEQIAGLWENANIWLPIWNRIAISRGLPGCNPLVK